MKGKKLIIILAPILSVIIIATGIYIGFTGLLNKNHSANLEKYDWPEIEVNSEAAGTAFFDISEAPEYDGELSSLLLLKDNNPDLSFNIALNIDGNTATALLPAGTAIDSLKLSYTYSGSSVKCGKKQVISGETSLDFTKPVTLELDNGSEITAYIMTLNTGIPSVSVTLEGFEGVTTKTEYSACNVFAGGGDYSKNDNYAFGKNTTLSATGKIKGRGWSSWYYHPKKSYTLKFDTAQPFLDLPAHREWVLSANYSDRSLIRNAIGMQLAYCVDMETVMNVRFVDLWLNGEYMGTYNLVEKIEIDQNRVDITDFNENLAPENIGFIIEANGHNRAEEFALYTNYTDTDRPSLWQQLNEDFTYDPVSGDIFYYSEQYGLVLTISKPSDDKLMKLSEEKRNKYLDYISNYINELEQALVYSDFETASQYLDMKSMAQYYIVNELAMNVDSQLHASCYMYKDAGGKLTMGPLWDFDLGLGNGQYANESTSYETYLDGSNWFKALVNMSEFRDLVKQVWNSAQKDINKINSFIDDTAEMLNGAQEANFTVWDITEYAEYTYERTTAEIDQYSEQIEYIKSFIAERIDYMNLKMRWW